MSICLLLPFFILLEAANAFVVPTALQSTVTTLSSSSTAAITATTPDNVKGAGFGIAVVDAGGRYWDPEIEGKLQGSGSLTDRLANGVSYTYLATTATPAEEKPPVDAQNQQLKDTQHWLEDIGVPTNTYKPKQPATAKVLGRVKLISDDAPGDIQHIVMKLPDDMNYVEGQSLSVIPPGQDDRGKPHAPRLYSIASTRYGDLLDGSTISLCVRRAEYMDPTTGVADPAKKGVCSNYLCDTQPGDAIHVAGPVGKTMLLPEDPTKDIIMVATGTGIAPFRGFLHRLFMENTVARHQFSGKAWLILGVPVTGGLLYPDELQAMQDQLVQAKAAGESSADLEVTYAISREMKNEAGGKLYVQDVLASRADELFEKLSNGAVIYFCGLKGMMPGILEALEQVAKAKGIDWAAKLKELQSNHQWHVEVY